MKLIQIGNQYQFLRPTFLYKGVFILQNSLVTVKSMEREEITVEWCDREGGKHLLTGVRAEELGVVSS